MDGWCNCLGERVWGSVYNTPTLLFTHSAPSPYQSQCDFKPWYAELGYQLEEDMPKHPFIRKPLYEVFPTMRFDMRFGQYHDGPVAGRQRQFDGAFLVEVGVGSLLDWLLDGRGRLGLGRLRSDGEKLVCRFGARSTD